MTPIRKRLSFCINPGRSGSEYVAALLATARHVDSGHEREPNMSGRPLHRINVASYEESFEERKVKAKAIRHRLRRLVPGGIYAETNHMFIKTFWDVVADEFDHEQLDVIILRREFTRTLKSFVELGYFTALNRAWPEWMSSPAAVTAAIRSVGPDESLDQYDLCIAYLIDIEARALRFQRDLPDVRVHEVRLEALNEPAGVDALFGSLAIEPTKKTTQLVGSAVNQREKRKTRFDNPTSIEYCQERVDGYLRRLEDLGVDVPQTLALTRSKGGSP